VPFGLTRKRFLCGLAIVLFAFCAFALGFVSCLHLKRPVSSEIREHQLLEAGDATPEVRAQVLTSLRAFQAGYVRRNPADVDSFMKELFPKDGQIILLGTEGSASEWARGYSEATNFIRRDWVIWGDLRLDVDHSLIWSSGDVAWLVTVGTVHSEGGERPIRFTAILTRDGDRWLFRQMNFQWDDTEPETADIFHPRTYLRLIHAALRRMGRTVGIHH
jgi:SnoaL-like domain